MDMLEEMYEEIKEHAQWLDTKEELYDLIDDMETRWRIRGIYYGAIESVIDDFKDDFHLD